MYQMRSHEREYVADIFEWALQVGIQTIEIRAFIQHKKLKNGLLQRVPGWKCRLMALRGNEWRRFNFEADSMEELKFSMADYIAGSVKDMPESGLDMFSPEDTEFIPPEDIAQEEDSASEFDDLDDEEEEDVDCL